MGWVVNSHDPAALYPREIPGTPCTGGWVGPRAGLDRCGKYRPPLGFQPRTVQLTPAELQALLYNCITNQRASQHPHIHTRNFDKYKTNAKDLQQLVYIKQAGCITITKLRELLQTSLESSLCVDRHMGFNNIY